MSARALDGACLERLVGMASPLLRAAQQKCRRRGPGRSATYQDWQIAVLILIAIIHRRKTKSAQYRFLLQRRATLRQWMHLTDFPARSTYFERYRSAHLLFERAIGLQGLLAIKEGLVDAGNVAVDKSLIAAQGPPLPSKRRSSGQPPPTGCDREAAWCRSNHDGWVYGFSYEVFVSAPEKGLVFPLLASADAASASECRSFLNKAPLLPEVTENVLADAGYDSNACQEAVEYDADGKATSRRFICPLQSRGNKPAVGQVPHRGQREQRRQRRKQRQQLLDSPEGRNIYRLRGQTVEPFNEWFKNSFQLSDRAWHRGLANNQTQLLAAIFIYQLLIRDNCRRGYKDNQIQWILDVL
jgi:hypothetical protein